MGRPETQSERGESTDRDGAFVLPNLRPQAFYHLARYYEDKRAYDRSFKYHGEGAELGEPACMRGLARAFSLGRGVAKDEEQARFWTTRAQEAYAEARAAPR